LRIDLEGDRAATRAYDLVNRLLEGEPAIAVDQSHAEHGRLSINPQGLTAEEATVVARRLREELRG
jgi:seryl-tRNA(Sec) selenium transferase